MATKRLKKKKVSRKQIASYKRALAEATLMVNQAIKKEKAFGTKLRAMLAAERVG